MLSVHIIFSTCSLLLVFIEKRSEHRATSNKSPAPVLHYPSPSASGNSTFSCDAEIFKNVSEHQLPRPVSFPFRPHSRGIINTTRNRGIGKCIRNAFPSPHQWAVSDIITDTRRFPDTVNYFKRFYYVFFLRISANSDNTVRNRLFDVLET